MSGAVAEAGVAANAGAAPAPRSPRIWAAVVVAVVGHAIAAGLLAGASGGSPAGAAAPSVVVMAVRSLGAPPMPTIEPPASLATLTSAPPQTSEPASAITPRSPPTAPTERSPAAERIRPAGPANAAALDERADRAIEPARRPPPLRVDAAPRVAPAANEREAEASAKTLAVASDYALGPRLDPGPRPLDDIEPEYLDPSLREGTVVLRLLISAAGHVDRVDVVRAEPTDVFEQAAVDAFAKARFSPGMAAGTPVKSQITVEVSFLPIDRGGRIAGRTY